MIRQARSYLFGAMSGAALVAAAIAAFVLLISARAFVDWPISSGAGEDQAATSPAGQPAPRVDETRSRPATEEALVGSRPEARPGAVEVSPAASPPVEVASTPASTPDPTPPSEPAPTSISPGGGSRSTPTPSVRGRSGERIPSAPSPPVPPANSVTDTVEGTVAGVDDVLRRTVDRTVETVRGLLGGDR